MLSDKKDDYDFLRLLVQELGLPKHISKISVHLEAKEPTKIELTYYPTDIHNKFILNTLGDAIVSKELVVVLDSPQEKEHNE